jgi:glycosyltransferase involved in cell wall biosynthesis
MTVVILHQHFKTPESGGAIRSYYLARALADRGITTVVITTHSGIRKVEHREGIEVRYLPVAYDNRFGFWRRINSFLRFLWLGVSEARNVLQVDYYYAISTPLTVGLMAQWLKRRTGIPYFFEVGDLWPEAPIQLGYIRQAWLKKWLYRLERSIYQNAKAVVALSGDIEAYVRKTSPETATHIIPNMADCEFYQPTPKLPDPHHSPDTFVIAYLGALGVANGLDFLLDCAKEALKAKAPIHVILGGDGARRDHLAERIAREELLNVTMMPFQNREGVRQTLARADAVFICYQNKPVLQTGSPNKYFDGLAAGKIVMVNVGGWMRDEVERENCGFFVDPARPSSLFERLAMLSEADRQLMKENARALAVRKYNRAGLSEKFAGLFR